VFGMRDTSGSNAQTVLDVTKEVVGDSVIENSGKQIMLKWPKR